MLYQCDQQENIKQEINKILTIYKYMKLGGQIIGILSATHTGWDMQAEKNEREVGLILDNDIKKWNTTNCLTKFF